ncbi:MAG: cupin domain-containing protein [Lautropia sp.]|nr:cupin domain-containing protein [Lautropia sp.]
MSSKPLSSSSTPSLPVEIDAAGGPSPLGMSPGQFLRDYWQKRPLLIRNAFPDFVSPIQPEDLAGLSCEEGSLGRLVSHDPATDAWTLRTGPFDETEFPGMPDHDWTLLVQDVDKWDPDVRALLDHFRFLPAWRMDDIMVSFAAPGGSVGAHIDNYDVFLLQGVGHRRWQIDTRPDPDDSYRDDVPLRLLRHFDPDQDWVLKPGDMLYLPPGVPHHGIAEDACLTISVGLRAPSSAELLEDYIDTLTFEADERVRYVDPDLAVPADPYEIDDAAIGRVMTALQRLRMDDPARLGDWFGRFITSYRVAAGQMPSEEQASGASVLETVANGLHWQRHPYSRMAWRRTAGGAQLFANARSWPCDAVEDVRRIVAAETIDEALLAVLGESGRALLQQLADAGHYVLLDGADADLADEDEGFIDEDEDELR